MKASERRDLLTICLTEGSNIRAKCAPLGWVSPAQVVHPVGDWYSALLAWVTMGREFRYMHTQDADVAPLCASTRERL